MQPKSHLINTVEIRPSNNAKIRLYKNNIENRTLKSNSFEKTGLIITLNPKTRFTDKTCSALLSTMAGDKLEDSLESNALKRTREEIIFLKSLVLGKLVTVLESENKIGHKILFK